MAPNSEETGRLLSFSKTGQSSWNDNTLNKEKQRPPIYNPEDYAISLKKWGRRPLAGSPGLYTANTVTDSAASIPEHVQIQISTPKDYRNLSLTSGTTGEMTLKQFGTVSELLIKLRTDLKLAFPSFVQEFIGDPLDGVTLLLELLRAIQLSQAAGNDISQPGNNNTISTTRMSPALQRRALLDELACLQCLLCCCQRYTEAIRRLASSPAGLFTLAVCIMSNVHKSRIIALELLTKACEPIGNGHTAVSEALSTLRLRFGEPVRFRFLIGMLTSAGHCELLASGMKFLNTFLESANNIQRRLYIQAELEQAGFDITGIKKILNINPSSSDLVFLEVERWERSHIDIETISKRAEEIELENNCLKEEVTLLGRRNQILQEEKGILISLEQCLKERCCELQDEVMSLKSDKGKTTFSRHSTMKIKIQKYLNAIEMVWNQIKKYIATKNTTFKSAYVRELITEAYANITTEQWSNYDKHTIKAEEKMWLADQLQDDIEPFIVQLGNESSEDDSDMSDFTYPIEDEGISSSERSEAPEKILRDFVIYDMYSTKKDELIKHEMKKLDDEQETTIEEVMEEFQNIINNAEIEAYESENKAVEEEKGQMEEIQIANSKIQMRVDSNVLIEENSLLENEAEIIPSILYPQPPQRTRSLIHLYVPTEEYEYHQKEMYFDNETQFISDKSSDSLLSASKCQVLHKQNDLNNANRELLNTIMDARDKAIHEEKYRQRKVDEIKLVKRSETFQHNLPKIGKENSIDGLFQVTHFSNTPVSTPTSCHQKSHKSKSNFVHQKIKSKSLDRIDDGLDAMVNIIVTSEQQNNHILNDKSDSGHVTETTIISRNTSNIYSYVNKNISTHAQQKYEESMIYNPKSKNIIADDSKFYFPRVQDSNFMIKRGHINAGLYSGKHTTLNTSVTNQFSSAVTANNWRSLSCRTTEQNSGKLTDLPSGLY